jgi:hypothetical protein
MSSGLKSIDASLRGQINSHLAAADFPLASSNSCRGRRRSKDPALAKDEILSVRARLGAPTTAPTESPRASSGGQLRSRT